MSDGVRLDLHVHTVRSPDSGMTLEAIAARLPYTGLSGLAVTDHNRLSEPSEIAALRAQYPRYLVIPGIEISTHEGHLLAYGVREMPPVHRPVAETIDWVRARGGVTVLAHPFRWAHGVGPKVVAVAPVTAIETRNGHNSEIANLRAEAIAAHRALPSTGGSDAHSLGDLGRAYTELENPVADVEELLDALRHGRSTGNGRSLRWAGRLRLGVRSGLLLASRGFRPI
jgi:predicted metal-dependent phosphoesterase TrpH